MFAVVVTGLPGSGKSTLAAALAPALGLPLFGKDHIKELLADQLTGVASLDLGRAAIKLMLALAAMTPEVLLESFFWPGMSEPELLDLQRPLLQVHCACPLELARARFDRRGATGARHPVHPPMQDWEPHRAAGGLLSLPGPLISVDTTSPVDVTNLASEVHTLTEAFR